MNKIFKLVSVFMIIGSSYSIAKEVNLFTSRHYDSDVELYKKFTAKTGIKVNVVSGKAKALEKRLLSEGKSSKADVYITCLLYTSPSPRDRSSSRMPSCA